MDTADGNALPTTAELQAELDERREWYLHLIDMLKERARNIDDFLRQARPYFSDDVEYDEEALAIELPMTEEFRR